MRLPRYANLSWSLFFLGFSCIAFASPSIESLEVTSKKGTPCFNVEKTLGTKLGFGSPPVLHTIQVGEKFLNNALVWSVVSAPEQRGTLYEFHECLLYATQFSNTEVRQPALPLNPGVVYSAAAWVSFNGQGKVVTGEFCLITQPDGSSKVHQIEYNDGWQYGACYLKQ